MAGLKSYLQNKAKESFSPQTLVAWSFSFSSMLSRNG